MSFRERISSLPVIQATGFLAITLVGLTPTEHENLLWTRILIPNQHSHYNQILIFPEKVLHKMIPIFYPLFVKILFSSQYDYSTSNSI